MGRRRDEDDDGHSLSSASSSSSPSERDRDRKKDRKHKKHKKHKHKTSSKHTSRRSRSKSPDHNSRSPSPNPRPHDTTDYNEPSFTRLRHGAAPIDPQADYFLKSDRFIVWLKESKRKYLSDLSATASRRYFRKFAQAWNQGVLDVRYYTGTGLATTNRAANERTGYRWKFKGVTEEEAGRLYEAKDSVDGMTGTEGALSTYSRDHRRQSGVEGGGGGAQGESASRVSSVSATNNPNLAPVAKRRLMNNNPDDNNNDMDEEDRRRYDRQMDKKRRKEFDRTKDTVMEELVPKPTGRDAMLEKRKTESVSCNFPFYLPSISLCKPT